MNALKSLVLRALGCLLLFLIATGCTLAYRNIAAGAHHSWWLVAALVFLPVPMGQPLLVWIFGHGPPSREVIEHAFDRLSDQTLRSVRILYPQGWRYKKLGVGLHSFFIEQCAFQAAISIELNYLNSTEINTLEGYLAYAVEFAKGRKSRLLYNRIAQRWGMTVHEFADQSPRTAGQRVTVPYHGTEYGFQLRLDDLALAPAARQLFERFLEHIAFETPSLTRHSAFGGRLSIALPPEFALSDPASKDKALWKSTSRQNCTIEVQQCLSRSEPMSAELLLPLISLCPRPAQAADDLSKSRLIALGENGFGGYGYYQANDDWGWFAAVGDLPSGGRYVFCLDDRDPRQEPYYGIYHYQQMAYEILVTLSERD